MRKRNTETGDVIPCELCETPTRMLGTKRCDRCWELETRIQHNPELAKRILDALNLNTVASNTATN